MHLALCSYGARPGKGNISVPGITVQLGSGAVVGSKAVLQRVVGGAGQTHRIPERLFQEHIQAFAGDFLDHERQQHIIHVRINSLGTRFVHQRRFENGMQRFGAGLGTSIRSGIQHIHGTRHDGLTALIVGIVVILRVCGEACLMAQDIAQGQFCLPLLVDLQARVLVAVVGNIDGVLHKGAAQQVYQTAVQIGLALRDKVLQCVVCGVHLGVGGQIVQGIVSHSRAVGLGGAVRVIGVDLAPGVLVHQLAVFHNGHLCAGEAIVHVCLNDLLQQFQCIAVDAHVLQAALLHGGVAHPHGHLFAAGTDAAHLNGVAAVDGLAGNVHVPHAACRHGSGVDLAVIDEQVKAGHARLGLHAQRSLPCVAHKGVHVVHGQRIVDVALPVGEHRLALPAAAHAAAAGHLDRGRLFRDEVQGVGILRCGGCGLGSRGCPGGAHVERHHAQTGNAALQERFTGKFG